MELQQNADWWPSREMQPKVTAAVVTALTGGIHWETIEAIAQPVYDYITELFNERGAESLLLNAEGDELTIGVAAWDENQEEVLASNQFKLSDAAIRSAWGDAGELEGYASAIRKSLAIVEAEIQKLDAQGTSAGTVETA